MRNAGLLPRADSCRVRTAGWQNGSPPNVGPAQEGFHVAIKNRPTVLKPQGSLAPKKHSQPRVRGVQFQIGAVLQHSITPSLRVAGFEDEDENEAPHAASSSTVRVTQGRGQRLLNHVVNRLGDDLVPDPGRMGGIPEKVLIWVRYHGATMR